MEIFTDGLRFKQIAVGAHHNLLLSEEGDLYGFGARMNGQIDGINYDGREEQCSILPISFPESVGKAKIKSIDARSLKSQMTTVDGQVWFWGGYFYDGRSLKSKDLKQLIDGFNLLNEEAGIPKDATILSYGMGFAHDTVLL